MAVNQSITPPPPHHSFKHGSNTPLGYENKRLREFDALRGFSMILVVFSHVLLCAGIEGNEFAVPTAITMFRMPLFFFVSGFFAYRDLSKWTGPTFKRVLAQKVKAQIVCTMVFYTFRYYTLGADPIGWLDKGFQGYWFTIVLFQMFVLYTMSNIISLFTKRNISLEIMAVVAVIGFGLIASHIYPEDRIWIVISGSNLCYFIQWFVLGLAVRKYHSKFERMISGNDVKALLIVGFVGICCLLYTDFFKEHETYAKMLSVIGSYVGLISVVSLFYSAKDYFQRDSQIPNTLCFVGRRTLDIYMLHYFFLPSLIAVGPLMQGNLFFQLSIGLLAACVVSAFSLAMSWSLRTSPLLADWLFGVRPKIKYVRNER